MSEAVLGRLLRSALVGGALSSGAAAQDVEGPAVSLREVIERAVASAPEVKAAAAAQAESEAASRPARGGFRPELWLNTVPGYVAGVPGPVLGRLPSALGVELKQGLYDADRMAQAEEAKARLAETEGGLAASRGRAAEAAAALFGRCRAGDAVVRAAEARAKARQSAQGRAERLHAEGRATELDVRRARWLLAQAGQDLQRARSGREIDELALRRLMAWPPEKPLNLAPEPIPDEPLPETGDDLAVARASDPQLRSLADRIVAEERALRIRGRWLAPTIEIGAQYSRLYKTADWDDFYRTFKPDNWSLGASISLPLFTSGRLGAEEARTRAVLDRLNAERAARERDLEIDLRRARAALLEAREGIEVARLGEAVAREGLRVASALLAEGRLEPADLAESEQSLAEAERDLAGAEADLIAARVRRLSLRGELVGAR